MQYYQTIFTLLGTLNVRVLFKHKNIVFKYALSEQQAVKFWAD